jgi:PAS domain S-box-containing protein
MTLFAALMPVVIFALLIHTSGDRFKSEINQAVQSGRDREWLRGEAFLRLQGEERVRAKARDVALQLNLVLAGVPRMTLRDIQRDPKFHEVAVQRVGRTGYTALYETRTGIVRFDRERKYENANLRRFSKSLPAFWAIVRKSLGGKPAGGYYDWKEPDGHLRQKYMYTVPLSVRTGDGVRLTVAATAYVDEFTQAIREAEAVHQETTRFLVGTIGASIQDFQKTGLVEMGLGIAVACLFALCVGRYFSRTIGRLRDATSRVNAGDYAVRVRASTSGDLGTLVTDFNTMVAQLETTTVSKHLLEESQEKLRQANAELELRVTERTARLSESEQRYRELVELLPEVVFETDVEGFYTYANRQALDTLGYASEELRTGIHMRDAVAPKDYARMMENADRIQAGEVREGDEYILRRKDGSEFPVLIRAARIVQDGRTVGLRGIAVDLTQSKRAEEEKIRLEEQVRQAQKMEAIGTLAGGIAHDFNNILAAVVGFTEMAMDDTPDGSSLRSKLDRVHNASLRGRDLVKQILTFSRKAEEERRYVALTPLVRETFRFLRASLPATIEIQLDSSCKTDLVLADPTQIEQVIMNLATNAAYAMGNKGGLLEIRMSDMLVPSPEVPDPDLQPGTYVRLSVLDTGCGMDRLVLARIFDPFFTTKRPGEGTGLGLSVVHGIIKAHQGAITVSSQPGKGSTFTVYLPKAAPPVVRENADITPIKTGHERILFVDDEKDIADMGEATLQGLGYQVTVIKDSAEAVRVFSETPDLFDLVVTDQNMPNLTGMDLAREVLSIRPDIPVVLCTGYSEKVPLNTEQAGIRGYITKPVTRRELAAGIRHALDGHRRASGEKK